MITREAKFYLTDKWSSSDGHQIEYRILLEDADGVDVKYLVTDYFNSDGTMHDTVIFNDNEDQNMVDSDSYIGKKILAFMENPSGWDINASYKNGVNDNYRLDN